MDLKLFTQLYSIFISILFAGVVLKLVSPYLKSIMEEIVGDKLGKDFISLVSFVIISGSIAKGIQSGKVFSSRLLRTNLIRILNSYLDLTLDVVRNSLGFIIMVLSIVLFVAFLGHLIILRKKTP